MKPRLFIPAVLVGMILMVGITSATLLPPIYSNGTQDGYVAAWTGGTYTAIRAASGAEANAITYANYARLTASSGGNYDEFYRAVMLFNKSAVVGKTINSVTLVTIGAGNSSGLGAFSYGVTGFNPTNSDGTFVAGDYSRFYNERWADSDIAYASLSVGGFNNWTGNDLFKSNLSASGTWIGVMIRDVPDIDNNTALITYVAGNTSRYSFEDSGDGTSPYLVIDYSDGAAPVTAFTANTTAGPTPLAVNFTDSSTNTPTDWAWYFWDNETVSSTDQNPSTVLTTGLYNIRLNASNSHGFDWENKTAYINVTAAGVDPWEGYVPESIEGYIPMSVDFTDISFNSPTNWSWSFRNVTGDDVEVWFSTEQNPSHWFNYTGNYSIVLNASNSHGYNITPTLVFVNASAYPAPPVAGMSANVTSGTSPLAVGFTDSSTNTPTNWDWYFGNGTKFSDDQNPAVTLTTGTYTINFYASNAEGGDWANFTDYITVSAGEVAPVTDFSSNVTSGAVPLGVEFYDLSTNTPTNWSWYWYDNETISSEEANPTASFTSEGLVNVRLYASNGAGGDWENKTSYINATAVIDPPVAGFAANVTSGTTPLAVTFTDNSTNTPDDWNWYWYDNETKSSDDQNPSTVFTAGTYSVRLYAANGGGGDWENKTSYITASERASAFSANETTGLDSLPVKFTDASTGAANNWDWYFWDNETKSSDDQNPELLFTPGVYSIRLYTTNAYGEGDWENKTAYISVTESTPPVTNFVANATSGTAPLQVGFTDLSTNTPDDWDWYWSDDEVKDSDLQNPTVSLPAGVYNVRLYTSNVYGGDWENKTAYITATTPSSPGTSAFTMEVSNASTGGFVPIGESHIVYRGDTVRFTDNSTGSPTSWEWGFGDGFESTTQNPEHTYTFGKRPIIMKDGYKDLEVSLSTPEGGTYTDTIRFTSPLAPIVTQATNITLMNETLADNFTEALTGNRTAPPGWSGFDWLKGISTAAEAYESVLGIAVFLILIFSLPFLMNWIATKDFIVAGVIGGVLGIYIIARLPAQLQLLAVGFLVMSGVAIVYSLLKERV